MHILYYIFTILHKTVLSWSRLTYLSIFSLQWYWPYRVLWPYLQKPPPDSWLWAMYCYRRQSNNIYNTINDPDCNLLSISTKRRETSRRELYDQILLKSYALLQTLTTCRRTRRNKQSVAYLHTAWRCCRPLTAGLAGAVGWATVAKRAVPRSIPCYSKPRRRGWWVVGKQTALAANWLETVYEIDNNVSIL